MKEDSPMNQAPKFSPGSRVSPVNSKSVYTVASVRVGQAVYGEDYIYMVKNDRGVVVDEFAERALKAA
jgi:hypothetical protein